MWSVFTGISGLFSTEVDHTGALGQGVLKEAAPTGPLGQVVHGCCHAKLRDFFRITDGNVKNKCTKSCEKCL